MPCRLPYDVETKCLHVENSERNAEKPATYVEEPEKFSTLSASAQVAQRHREPYAREEAPMRRRWSIDEIVVSLEGQAAFHRERQTFHAGHEALRQKERRGM
jgi:hypothetical protein